MWRHRRALFQEVVQLPVLAILHNDAVTRSLSTYSSGRHMEKNAYDRKKHGKMIKRTAIYLNETMLGWLSFLRCLMSVSCGSRTFFTATHSAFNRPKKTAPWAPLPSHCKSRMFSNGTSQSSEIMSVKKRAYWWYNWPEKTQHEKTNLDFCFHW